MNDQLQIPGSRLCTEHVFRDVFQQHFKVLRNFLVYRYKDVDRAEDSAQNAFVKLWEKCGEIEPVQAKSFLFTTAIRNSLNLIRHDQVTAKFTLEFRHDDSDRHCPEFLTVEKELKHQLEQAINELPEKQRTVFLMNRMENQSYKEIAALLDISVKAVEKRMHLALLSLRKVLQIV